MSIKSSNRTQDSWKKDVPILKGLVVSQNNHLRQGMSPGGHQESCIQCQWFLVHYAALHNVHQGPAVEAYKGKLSEMPAQVKITQSKEKKEKS